MQVLYRYMFPTIGIIPTHNIGFTYRIPIISLYSFTVCLRQSFILQNDFDQKSMLENGHSLLYQPCALNHREDLGNFFCASKYKEHWWNFTVFHHCALEQKRCESELGPEKELIKCKSPLLLMKSCPTLLDKHIMSLAC